MRALHLAVALALVAGPTRAIQGAADQERADAPVLMYWERSLAPDAGFEVGDLLVRVDNYAEANYTDFAGGRTFTNQFERPSSAHWFASFQDLEALMRFEREAARDEGWTALLAELGRAAGDGGDRRYLFQLGGAGEGPQLRCRWMQVARAALPDVPLARRLARDLVEHLEASYDEIDARAYTANLHDPGAILWLIDYPDLAAWQAVQTALLSDERYLELAAAGRELLVPEAANEALLIDVRLDPQLAQPFMQGLFLKDLGELEAATVCLRQAAELTPRDTRVHSNLSYTLLEAGDLEGAVASFERWIELQPRSGAAHADLGWTYSLLGDLDRTRASYERAMEVEPRYADAYGDLAWVLVTYPGERDDLEEAQALSQRALELDPDDGSCWAGRAAVLYRAGELEGCIAAFARARELGAGGESVDAFLLALAHHGRGELGEARRWYALGLERAGPLEATQYHIVRLRGEVESVLGPAADEGHSR